MPLVNVRRDRGWRCIAGWGTQCTGKVPDASRVNSSRSPS